MKQRLIVSIVPTSGADSALNNLTEAEYDPKNISVVMKDIKIARSLAPDTGPLKGVDYIKLPQILVTLGMPQKDSQTYQSLLMKDNTLIAISAVPQSVDSAKEILSSAGGTAIFDI